MKVNIVDLKDIKPYYNNPRDNAGAVPAVMESFKRYGFIKPIICDKDGVIIAGHTRYIAAFQLNLTSVPVVYSDMDEENAKLFRIADNKLAEKSEFDENLLIEELKRLEVPQNLQTFFFESIDEMVNFSYQDFKTHEESYSFDSQNSEEYSLSETSETTGLYHSEEKFYSNEDDELSKNSDEESSEYDDLYKVKIVDGKKTMKVVCPYCANIETINIE